MRIGVVALGVVLTLVGFAPTAGADVIFTLGNVGSVDTENILFKAGDTGGSTSLDPITAFIGQTDIQVDFWSLTTETLYQNAQGQAMIKNDSDGNPGDELLTSIAMAVPGYTFTAFKMNPLNGNGWATVTALDNAGAVYSYELGNGQNYLTITTENGQSIRELQVRMYACNPDPNHPNDCVTTPVGFEEFKQPRIGAAICAPGTPNCEPFVPVPEPASMLLLGTGLLGAGLAARRRKR